MKIRKAEIKDCPKLLELLAEIGRFHYERRPDVFRADAGKYSLTELSEMLTDATKPIFVAVSDRDEVLGYAMCQVKENTEHTVLAPYKVLYLDDLCVDENARKLGAGGQLMDVLIDFAREEHCSRVELNVWEMPDSAKEFYEHHGFKTQRREMEFLL